METTEGGTIFKGQRVREMSDEPDYDDVLESIRRIISSRSRNGARIT